MSIALPVVVIAAKRRAVTKMNKMIKLLKKYWFLTLLAFLAIVLVGLRLFITSEKTLPLEEITPTAQPDFGTLPEPESVYFKPSDAGFNYQINLSTTEFDTWPKILPVYQLKKITEKEATDLVKPIVKAAELGKPEKTNLEIGTFLSWSNDLARPFPFYPRGGLDSLFWPG